MSTGSNCYSIGNNSTSGNNGAKAELSSGKFALGGNPGGTAKPTTIGAAGLSSFGSCGECIGKMLSDSSGSKGPGCCLSACNRIGINGAPTTSDAGSTWSDGSDIWSDFWPDDTYDENYRTSDSQSAWGACLGNTTANSIYTLPCNPTSYCDNGDASMPSILETNYSSSVCTCQTAGIYPAGVSCQPSVPPTNPPSLTLVLKCSDTCGFTPTAIVGYSNCVTKKSYMAFYVGDCSTIETCAGTVPVDGSSGSGCAANIPVIYDKFYDRSVNANNSADIQATVIDTTKSQIASQLGTDAGSCGVGGRGSAIGNVTKLSITGLVTCSSGGGCPTRGSTSGYFGISTVRSLLASGYSTGGGGGQDPSMSSDETASCCLLTIQSPWTPPDNSWNVQNCKDTGEPHLNWIQEAFGEGSSCISNPCEGCPD